MPSKLPIPTHGSPLPEVVEKLQGVEHAILLILDGCRADTLYEAIDGGDLPSLKKLLDEFGHVRYERCTAPFPSVTLTGHSTLLTGAWPGTHGIVGNEWFDRDDWGGTPVSRRRPLRHVTREYIKFSVLDPGSDPGLANSLLATGGYFGLADADLTRVRTLYEAWNRKRRGESGELGSHFLEDSVAILEMVARGADHRDRAGALELVTILKGIVWGVPSRLMSYLKKRQFLDYENQGLDYRALGSVLDHLQKEKVPGLMVAWLPGLDGFSHRSGARQQGKYFRRGRLDALFGELHRVLRERGLADKTALVITSDHGQYETKTTREHRVREEDLYEFLRGTDAGKRETLPLTASGKLQRTSREATLVVCPNGGMAHVYLKAKDREQKGDGWSARPAPADVERLCRALAKHPAADLVFGWHGPSKTYRLLREDKLVPLDEWIPGDDYPLGRERVEALAASGRAGDVLISAAGESYFSRQTYQGEHGSLRREDSHVPLVFASGRAQKRALVGGDWVSLADVAPTIAKVLGCYDELLDRATDEERLRCLLNCVVRFREKPPRTLWLQYGEALGAVRDRLIGAGFTRGRAVEDWESVMQGLSDALLGRATAYWQRGSITKDLYLAARDAAREPLPSLEPREDEASEEAEPGEEERRA